MRINLELDEIRCEELAAELIRAGKTMEEWLPMTKLLRIFGFNRTQIFQLRSMVRDARKAMKSDIPEMKTFQTQWFSHTKKISSYIRSLS